MLIWILIYAIAFAVVTALAAQSKGRDPFTWALVGFFFGVFGLIAVLVMKPDELEDNDWQTHSAPTPKEQPATKKCPDCAEEIKMEARVCRFCGKRFDETEMPHSPELPAQPQIVLNTKEHKIRDLRCPHCYTMNFDTDLLCAVCGKELPVEE